MVNNFNSDEYKESLYCNPMLLEKQINAYIYMYENKLLEEEFIIGSIPNKIKDYNLNYKMCFFFSELSKKMGKYKKYTNEVLTTKDSIRQTLKTFTTLKEEDIQDISEKVSKGNFNYNDPRIDIIKKELLDDEAGNALELIDEMVNASYLPTDDEVHVMKDYILSTVYNLYLKEYDL